MQALDACKMETSARLLVEFGSGLAGGTAATTLLTPLSATTFVLAPKCMEGAFLLGSIPGAKLGELGFDLVDFLIKQPSQTNALIEHPNFDDMFDTKIDALGYHGSREDQMLLGRVIFNGIRNIPSALSPVNFALGERYKQKETISPDEVGRKYSRDRFFSRPSPMRISSNGASISVEEIPLEKMMLHRNNYPRFRSWVRSESA